MKKNNSLDSSNMFRVKDNTKAKITKIAPHTYKIEGGGYRTMRDILVFNKKLKNESGRN